MVFFNRLAWPLLGFIVATDFFMKTFPSVTRLLVFALGLLPAIASAHPGHYHPDETDEFDSLRATFFHSHGAVDYLLAAVVVLGCASALIAEKPVLRAGALFAALGSLSLLPIF